MAWPSEPSRMAIRPSTKTMMPIVQTIAILATKPIISRIIPSMIMISPSRWWRSSDSADAVREPFDTGRKAMTGIGFVGHRGALGGLGPALLPMPQIASGKPVRRGHFPLTAADLSGRPVGRADRAVHQLGGQRGELTSLRPGLCP